MPNFCVNAVIFFFTKITWYQCNISNYHSAVDQNSFYCQAQLFPSMFFLSSAVFSATTFWMHFSLRHNYFSCVVFFITRDPFQRWPLALKQPQNYRLLKTLILTPNLIQKQGVKPRPLRSPLSERFFQLLSIMKKLKSTPSTNLMREITSLVLNESWCSSVAKAKTITLRGNSAYKS